MVAGLQRGKGSSGLAIDSSPTAFDIDPEVRGMCAFPANLGINDGKCQGGVSPGPVSLTRNILARVGVGVGRPSGN